MQNKLVIVDYRGDVFKKGVYIMNNSHDPFLTTFSFYDAVSDSWCNIYTACPEILEYMLDSLDVNNPNSSLFIIYKEAIRTMMANPELDITPEDVLDGQYSILAYNAKTGTFKIYNPAIKGVGLMTSLSFIEDVTPTTVYVGGIESKVDQDVAISDSFIKHGGTSCFRLERVHGGYYERIEETLPTVKEHKKPKLHLVPN